LLEGEDPAESIRESAEQSGIQTGVFILVGTLKKAILGFYEKRHYKILRFEGPLEIASCTGNVAIDKKGKAAIHAHIVVSNEKGEAFGGHLMKGSCVGATAELVIIEAIGVKLRRVFDPKTRLKLLKLD
jgi:predicted DNA-binding protein with PD1-like motif